MLNINQILYSNSVFFGGSLRDLQFTTCKNKKIILLVILDRYYSG